MAFERIAASERYPAATDLQPDIHVCPPSLGAGI